MSAEMSVTPMPTANAMTTVVGRTVSVSAGRSAPPASNAAITPCARPMPGDHAR